MALWVEPKMNTYSNPFGDKFACEKVQHTIVKLQKHTGISANVLDTRVQEYFDQTNFSKITKTILNVSFDIDEFVQLVKLASNSAIIKNHYEKEYDELLMMAMLSEND